MELTLKVDLMISVLEGSNWVINVLEHDLVVGVLHARSAPLYNHFVSNAAYQKGRI